MSFNVDGVLIIALLSTVLIWAVSTVWGLYDSIKAKKQPKWILINLIPLAGPLTYHLYGRNTEISKKDKLISLAKDRWTVLAIIIIIMLSMSVRLADYRWPYLRNIDSYTFTRQIEDIVANHGIIPKWDNLTLAPYGQIGLEGMNPYTYLGAYTYMFINSIAKISFFQLFVLFPPFLASLAAIPLYYLGKILYDRKAGVIAAFIFTFDVNNVAKSLGGDPDSDAIIFLISMITIMVLVFTYKYSVSETKISKKFLLYSVLTGIVLGIWFNTWAGYWYIFWLITGLVVLRILIWMFETKDPIKGLIKSKYVLLSFAIYMIIGFSIGVLSFDFNIVPGAIMGPINFQSIKGEDFQFPNVYVSVAELQQSGGPKDIIERTSVVGGPALLISPFFLLVYALIYLGYSYYKKKQHLDTILLMLIWFVGPFTATLIAIRFSTLFSAPMAIGSGIFLSKLIRMASGEDSSFGD